MRLWTGETIGVLGRQVTALALPTIAIRLLNAGPFQMGLLNGLEDLAFPIFGLFVGVWADRRRRKPMMIAANVGRMITIVTVPLAFLFGMLHLYLLYAVAFCVGLFTAFFDIAYLSYLPTLIEKADLVDGNSKLETSQQAARVAGPAISGILIELIGAAYAMTADVLAFLSSAVLIFSIRKEEPILQGSTERNLMVELKEGARSVFANPILRQIVACTATMNFGIGMFFAVFLLFTYEVLNLTPLVVGLIMMFGGVGLVIGAVSASRVLKILGLGRALAVSVFVSGLGLLAITFAKYGPSLPILIVFSVLSNVLIPVYNVGQISLRQTIVPARLQGRMNATMRTIVWGVLPLGSLIGGVLGTEVGIVWTMIIGSLVSALAAIWISFAPIISIRDMPQVSA